MMQSKGNYPRRSPQEMIDAVIDDFCRRADLDPEAGRYAVANILQHVLDDLRGYTTLLRIKWPRDVRWQDTNAFRNVIDKKYREEIYRGMLRKDTVERLVSEYENRIAREREEGVE